MSIDKNTRLFVLDFDNHLVELLKEYNIIKHSNYMSDLLDYDYKVDELICDLVYKDGDIFSLLKLYKGKPYILDTDLSINQILLLKKKINLISKNELFLEENYLHIESSLAGYELTLLALKYLLLDHENIANLNSVYKYVEQKSKKNIASIEKAIRYYKEYLFNAGIISSETTKFNKEFPTNTEFFRLLLKLYNEKKIKAD